MGNLVCGGDKKKNLVNDEHRAQQEDEERETKVLLFGPEHSGKDTILKQMKILHLGGFTKDERRHFKPIILNNICFFMRMVLITAKRYGIHLACFDRSIVVDDERQTIRRRTKDEVEQLLMFGEYGEIDTPVTNELLDILWKMWNDKGVCETIERYEREVNYAVPLSTAAYFFRHDNFSRLMSELEVTNEDESIESGIPTNDDLLRCRHRKTGITELLFTFQKRNFRMVDVRGGRRGEHGRWVHCFADVDAIVFFVDVSVYDQTLYEDNGIYQMHKAMKLFAEVCNTKFFEKTTIVLLLTKLDLFREKIAKKDLRVCFPDYQGGRDFNKVRTN